MKNTLLLPRKCRMAGIIMFPLASAWHIATYLYEYPVFRFLRYRRGNGDDFFGSGFIFSKNFSTDFNGEFSILAVLISLFMIAFSRERVEDEYVKATRLHALQVSVYVNYAVVAIGSFLFYSLSYLWVLQINMYSILILFIVVFNFNLHIKPRLSKNQLA